jgi:predicted metal-dependent hydrolase
LSFINEVWDFAKKLNLDNKIKSVEIKKLPKNKWAQVKIGFDGKGSLEFSPILLRQSKEFQQYAIIHEFVHLKGYGRHTRMFHLVVDAYLDQLNIDISTEKVVSILKEYEGKE